MKKVIAPFLLFTLVFISSFAQKGIENLGTKVNTIYSEVRPSISSDGKTLFYVVEGSPQNTAYKTSKLCQDIWSSSLDETGTWGNATHMPSPLNTEAYNAVFWVSPNGDKLLIRGEFKNGKLSGRGFSIVSKKDGSWSKPEKINIKGYSKMSVDEFTGATMSLDGKILILYFSEEKNSFINDLYISKLDEKTNEYSLPVKLGGKINTEDYDEISPFLATDGITLYFSSNRPGGIGDYDIYMSRRLDDTWKRWTDPVNMGDSINSANWDAYFTVDATGEYGFLSTTKNSTGGTDLAKAKISESKRPKSYINLFGKIYDADSKSPLNAKITYQIIDANSSEEKTIASGDSTYKTTLNYGKKYVVGFTSDKFYPLSDTFDLTKIDTYKEVQRDIYLNHVVEKPVSIDSDSSFNDNLDSLNEMLANLKVGQVLTSNRVLFDFAKSILRSDSYKSLDKMVKLMKLNPDMVIELSAHTDFIGSDKANQKLSEDRAIAARQYLISKGIDETRIVPKGYGSSVPVASNDTEEGRQQNRRVEFKILKK